MSATEKVPASHSRPVRTSSMCLSLDSRKLSKNLRIGVSSVSPENLKKDHGWLAASTEASAANSHSFTSLRPRGVRKMLGSTIPEGHAFHTIGQASLFQCPAHPYVAHVAARHFGNPIEGGENHVAHSQSPRN